MTDTAQQRDELAERLRKGDVQALAEVFALHRERLWRMVNFRLDRRLQGRVDPDDILQDGYLAAAQRLPHYAAKENMSPFVWLRLIVCQTLVDVHRRHVGAKARDAAREQSIEGAGFSQTTSASLASFLVARMTSASQVAVRAEVHAQLEAALAEMESIDQEVLALRHFEELSNSEVAEILNIQQKAASIRYVRAVRRLKTILAKVPGFFSEEEK